MLFVISGVFAQNGKLDSLQKLIATIPDDTAKVNAINQMVLTYREQNNFEALILANKAIGIAEKLNYPKGLATALEHLGWINYHKGSYSEAFELSEKALKIFEELQDQIGISGSLINMAAISYEQGKFDDAINKFKRAYEISSIYGEVYTMVRSLNNISFSYLALKELDSAKWYAEEAI
ncbi:MAG: tetratricopeptide repeat protein, partial [Cyclobacteriaceae bacterium]|nr:tetratricopeptide repeat protein [Cyclobacteriaceae bacterium]